MEARLLPGVAEHGECGERLCSVEEVSRGDWGGDEGSEDLCAHWGELDLWMDEVKITAYEIRDRTREKRALGGG